MSYIQMKIADVLDNLEETGYDFEEVAKRVGLSLREVKELAREFGVESEDDSSSE